jgi:hypothetical protein
VRRLLLVGAFFLAVAAPASAMRWLDLPDTTPPVISGMPSSFSVEATGPAGATATYTMPTANDDVDGPVPVTCGPGPGSQFPLGDTVVTCSAQDQSGNTASESFTISVVDTTSPSLVNMPSPFSLEATSPGGTIATYTSPTATDTVDLNPTVGCSPASGSSFALGSNTVTCTATDASSNSSQASFTITVTDTTKPVLVGVPASFSVEATNPAGTVVNYTPPTATDNADPSPSVNCVPTSGSTYPLGATPVSCTAQDTNGNISDPAGFTITVTDTTPPVLVDLPSSFSVEATGPSGAVATYTAPTATDNADPTPTVNCVPASGGTFPFGGTSVACTARDNSGHQTVGNFTITVADTTAPVLSGYGDKSVEANRPEGSVVNFPTPTAVDTVDGPIGAVTCAPVSGSTFPLGPTAVNCSATDLHGNTGRARLTVQVIDTTPPTIYLPTVATIVATSATGISSSDPAAQAYFQAVRAIDMIDAHPALTYEAASFLSVGPNSVTFHARDAGGNESVKTATLTVLPVGTPASPTPTPATPPTEVTNVKVTPLDGAVRIQWSAGGRKVMVTRSTSATRSLSTIGDERIVYTGTGSSYVDRGLTNGVEYRYVVMAVDAAGNHSAGVAAVIVPRRNLLKSPKDGARLKKAPKLVWALDAEAQYYNAQLLLNGKKILSVWPVRPAYVLKKSWKFEGRKYTLKPGVYTWFVWPGYAARSAVDYGELMGSRTFRIVR